MERLAQPPVAPPPPKTPKPHLVPELLAAIHRKKKEAGVYPGVPFN